MYQDRGAAGRMPVLIPVSWENDFPVFGNKGKLTKTISVISSRPGYKYEPLYTSDFFEEEEMNRQPVISPQWQWNHEPNNSLWTRTDDGGLSITTGKLCVNLIHAANMLTQRMMYPESTAEIRLDGTNLQNGDFAGLCALQGCYGWIGIAKELGYYYIVMYSRNLSDTSGSDITPDYMPGNEVFRIPLNGNCAEFKIHVDFTDGKDTAEFFYKEKKRWIKAGEQKLYFKLDHFTGCRFGLFLYATRRTGGEAVFWDFRYRCP